MNYGYPRTPLLRRRLQRAQPDGRGKALLHLAAFDLGRDHQPRSRTRHHAVRPPQEGRVADRVGRTVSRGRPPHHRRSGRRAKPVPQAVDPGHADARPDAHARHAPHHRLAEAADRQFRHRAPPGRHQGGRGRADHFEEPAQAGRALRSALGRTLCCGIAALASADAERAAARLGPRRRRDDRPLPLRAERILRPHGDRAASVRGHRGIGRLGDGIGRGRRRHRDRSRRRRAQPCGCRRARDRRRREAPGRPRLQCSAAVVRRCCRTSSRS